MDNKEVSESPFASQSPRESATRILADDGTWTNGDARLCAEFVLAANAELTERVDCKGTGRGEGE